MEILLVVYLVSFVFLNVLQLIEATQTTYSNGDVVLGFVMSLVPLLNTILVIAGIWEVAPSIAWFRKPFFIQPKNPTLDKFEP